MKKQVAVHQLKELFLKEYSEYESFFTLFVLSIPSDEDKLAGFVEDIGIRNVVLMKDFRASTLGHEFMHGMGLYHTHFDYVDLTLQMEEVRKYVFEKYTTRNVMSYSDVGSKEKIYLWKWQWKIANPKIK